MAHSERHEELAALQALGVPLGEESEEFSAHLRDGCTTCERLLGEFRDAANAFAAQAAPVRPRPEIREKLLASLGPARASSPPPGPSRALRFLVGLPAAIMLLFVPMDHLRLRRQREQLQRRTAQLSEHLDQPRRELPPD